MLFSIYLFIFHLFLLVWGQLLYNIVVVFVIHWHESAMDLHVFPIPIPPPTSLSTRSLWVFPVHQARALVSCIQPGLVICFTHKNKWEKKKRNWKKKTKKLSILKGLPLEVFFWIGVHSPLINQTQSLYASGTCYTYFLSMSHCILEITLGLL